MHISCRTRCETQHKTPFLLWIIPKYRATFCTVAVLDSALFHLNKYILS
ncbi:hypothetical protein NNO_1327 [Hydrogenimonas sp.]|nr:hypothetical protein NNO_1327 [Hydrogenimonas sp.]